MNKYKYSIVIACLTLLISASFVFSGKVYADNANPPGLGTSAADDAAEARLSASCPSALSAGLHTLHIIYPDPAISTASGQLTFTLKAGARVCDAVNRYGVHQVITSLRPVTAAEWPGCDGTASISGISLPYDFDPAGQRIRGASGLDYSDVRSLSNVTATGLKTGCNGFQYTYCAYSRTSPAGSVSSSCAGKDYFTITYNPPVVAPVPVVSCSISNIAITAGSSASAVAALKHSGPTGAPDVTVGGILKVQGRSDEAVNVAVSNGTTKNVTGTSYVYTVPGTYSMSGSFTATSSAGNISFECSGTITVKLPAPTVSCSIAPIAILAGSSASPSVTIKHNGPALAPAANVAGALTVQGQPSDSIGASLANGASVTKTGTSRTYVTAGTYTITGSFVATSSVSTTNFSCASTLTVTLPPPVISCVVGITSIEEGGSTAVPVTVRHDGPAYAPGVNYAAKIVIVSQPIQNLSGSLANGSSVTLATATNTYPLQGVYAVTVRVTGTGGGFVTSAACNGTVTVLRRPYIRAYGNDIQAGLGFYNSAGTCSTGVGNIRAYTRDGAGSYAGSGSQLGIFARGQITGFRSASMRADALLLPEILSLANTTAVNRSIGQFGGSFGSGSCINDYWSKSINATVLSSQNIDLAALPNGRYYVKQSTPGTPVSVTGLIPNGRRIALYVEGNAFIRGGASVGYVSSNWANRAEIPSLYIITKGNIMIGSDVKNLDGNYIAQNSNATDGRITTCADPNTLQTYATNASFLINCTNKLTINGSFSAQHVNFLRVAGTTRLAVPSESSTSSNAAEVFVYSLDTFLGDQAIEGHHQQTYDSITALPPSL